jgi:hypothetical protein
MHRADPDPLTAAAALIPLFDSISLEELGAAALMDRIDRKFLVPASALPGVLQALSAHYRILDVNGQKLFHYRTRYYDTPELALYNAHHSGRARRYKVRVRSYGGNEAGYLEVQLKTGRGRTLKERTPLPRDGAAPMEQLAREPFLGIGDKVSPSSMRESMQVEFKRLTLVRKGTPERITFDLMMSFFRDGKERTFSDVVIAEIKQIARAGSPFINVMRALNLREGSLSKYCTGIASLEPAAKSNRFREFLHRLEKIGR